MLSTPPTSARLRSAPSIIPAASIAAIMLVAHAITVENAGNRGRDAGVHQHLARESPSALRARVAPRQIGDDGSPHGEIGRAAVQLRDHVAATGVDNSIASKPASAPSTFANGVLTPAANQISVGTDRAVMDRPPRSRGSKRPRRHDTPRARFARQSPHVRCGRRFMSDDMQGRLTGTVATTARRQTPEDDSASIGER